MTTQTERQLIADLLSALEYHTEQTRPIEFSKVAIQAAREYLQKPAQRTWVGLTIDEVESGAGLEKAQSTAALDLSTSFWAGARWAEAKLKEKNT